MPVMFIFAFNEFNEWWNSTLNFSFATKRVRTTIACDHQPVIKIIERHNFFRRVLMDATVLSAGSVRPLSSIFPFIDVGVLMPSTPYQIQYIFNHPKLILNQHLL